jgi:hypothetical protein
VALGGLVKAMFMKAKFMLKKVVATVVPSTKILEPVVAVVPITSVICAGTASIAPAAD